MSVHAKTVRQPAVAGAFYPSDAMVLRRTIDEMVERASTSSEHPKALVVPHAGYVYSGPVAARAYALLKRLPQKPTRVVLLGPAHTVGFHGLALPAADALRTPLGLVPVDAALELAALQCPGVQQDARVHEREHSLEVQLPFLQRVLDDFAVLPLCVGQASPEEVAAVLGCVWGGPETLIVVSSDLSHYLPWEAAKRADEMTSRKILELDAFGLRGDQACGAHPLNGLLLAAKHRGLRAVLLDLRNSGDTAGDRSRVVGYGAFAFVEEARA